MRLKIYYEKLSVNDFAYFQREDGVGGESLGLEGGRERGRGVEKE